MANASELLKQAAGKLQQEGGESHFPGWDFVYTGKEEILHSLNLKKTLKAIDANDTGCDHDGRKIKNSDLADLLEYIAEML